MSKNMIKWTLGLLAVGCVLAMAAPAGAEIMDSANFDWKYEMDILPSAENLDGNETNDFHLDSTGGASSISDPPGVLTINCGGSPRHRYQSSNTGELWPYQGFSCVYGYTLEASLKIDPDAAEESKGVIMLGASPAESGATCVWMYIKKNGIGWYDPTNGYHMIASGDGHDNTDGFHTFRVAQLPNSGDVGDELYSVWRDNVEVATGIPGGVVVSNMIEFGDFGSGQAGIVEIDYFRFTEGAYEPIPEPGALVLLAGVLLSLLAWRRR